MAFGTPPFVSHVDGNQVWSGMGVVGTMGTADTGGTSLTLPIAVDPKTGAQYSIQLGTANFTEVGTPPVKIASGTITSLQGTTSVQEVGTPFFILQGGTLQSGTMTNTGTNVNIISGSSVGTILGGTIQNLNTGTITALASGTITGGTLQNLVTGTINALASGTITAGTVSVSIGTVGGAAANAAAASGNPNPVGGTDSGGTIRTILVDNTGVQRSTGTQVMSVGTLTTGTLQNLVSGTINALASGTITGGTLQNLNAGTLTAVTTVSNLTNGSVVMTVGTLTTGTLQNLVTGTINALAAGTITAGTLTNLVSGTLNALASGTVSIGTVTGKDANAVAQTANPVGIGGTDVGGTIRTVLVNSAGAMSVSGAAAGTNVNIVTGSLVGTILGGTLQNLNAGTITALGAGTITTGTVSVTIGTVTGKDANAVAQTANPVGIGGTDSGGTIRTVLVNSAGAMSVSGASSGTFNNIVSGSLVGTILGGTLQNLNSGTITALATGTITAGTVQVSAGTVVRTAPASSAGSFTAAGTINLLGSNTDAASLDIQGTYVGTGFFEGQSGTSSWFAINAVNQGGVVGTQTTGNGDYFLNTAGLSGARFRLTYSSGTLTYNAQTTPFQVPSLYNLGGSISNLGSVAGVGVVSNLTAGSVTMTVGTLTTGTLQNLVSGTLNALAAGTITGGTLQNLATGTLNAVTTVTTVSNLTNGSVILQSGTLSTGTLQNLASGTINALATGTITGGTLQNLNNGTLALVSTVTTVSNLTNGSVTMQVGTITTGSLSNLALLNAGTLTALGIGTVIKSVPAFQAGSFTAAGTINFTGSQYDTVGIDIGGTYVGTGFFEGQIGTSAFFAIPAITENGGIVGTQTTGNGDYSINTTGLSNARFRLTYSSGTMTYNAQQTAFESASQYITGGSITNIGSIANIGQLYNAGTVQNQLGGTITTVSNVTTGSFVQTAGTLTLGTLTNLVSGTINALAAGTITTGTVSVSTGTLNGGTLTNLNYGTINIDPKPIPVKTTRTTYGTTGTTGAAVFGTLVSSVGAGTYAYISGYQIVVASGTVDCAILDGTFAQTVPAGGTNMITRGQFVPGGGIARDLTVPYVSGTSGTICYWMGGAGTVYFQVDYWAST